MEQSFYDEYFRIENRHWWFIGRRRVIGAAIHRELGAANGRRILDVGCGTGAMLPHLRRFGDVEGIDSELAAIEHCRRRGEKAVQHVPGLPFPFAAESFDLVTLLDVIEHVDDDVAMLAETRRVLRPGGIALVTVPAFRLLWGDQDEIAHHRRRYTRPELVATLERAGFSVRRSTYFNTLLFPPIAAIRVGRRLAGHKPARRSDFRLTRPGRLNELLARAFGAEARIIERIDLPFGVSAMALAQRRAGSAGR